LHPVGELLFKPVQGNLLARVQPYGDWHYGDRLRLQGELKTPPEGESFSYREYLARQNIYSFMTFSDVLLLGRGYGSPIKSFIYGLREKAHKTVYLLFPNPEASLLAGILLGIESGIPEDVEEAFNETSTSHIIAISGFNIAIISGLFISLFGRILGRWRGALAAVLAIGIYAVLVGANAPVVRAAIMGGLSLFASLVGRRQTGINTLAFVAALMALKDPNVLWDIGFQLSFFATLGLVLFAEPLSKAFVNFASRWMSTETAERLAGPVGLVLLFTFAAQLTTLPLIVYYFQQFSLVSLLANPAILAVQPAVMILGGAAVILGLVYLPIGQLAAYLAWPFVVYTIRAVEMFARMQGGAIPIGNISLGWVGAFFVVLFTWTFAGERIRSWVESRIDEDERAPLILPAFVMVVLGILTVLAWRLVFSTPDGRLHLTVLEVGSGDALLIQSPTGRNLLIDGGLSPSKLSDGLGRRLPLTDRSLDYLVVAGTGDGQIAALPQVLVRFPPQNVLWSGPPMGTYAARELGQVLREERINVTSAQTGQELDLGEGARLQVLSANTRGTVLMLEWDRFRALLPIGLDFDSMEALSENRQLGPVNVLFLAESGLAPLNTAEWIARWNPQVVLLSVAADDRDGLPDPETLDAVEDRNLLRTDQNGWIQISTDGEQMWVEVERQ
jgi:competence protein ComEC